MAPQLRNERVVSNAAEYNKLDYSIGVASKVRTGMSISGGSPPWIRFELLPPS